jgi:hypothetical protein
MPADHTDRVASHVSRRRLLAGLGGLAAGTGAYLTVGASPVLARVSADGLAVEDDSYAAPNGDLYSPRLAVDVSYTYEGVDDAAAVMLALLVDGGLVTSTVIEDVTAGSDTGTETLAGPVVASRAWTTGDWQPPTDSEVSHDIVAELRLEVRDTTGATLVKDSASDTATITVSDAGPVATATLSGDGDVSFLPSDDATPTE